MMIYKWHQLANGVSARISGGSEKKKKKRRRTSSSCGASADFLVLHLPREAADLIDEPSPAQTKLLLFLVVILEVVGLVKGEIFLLL